MHLEGDMKVAFHHILLENEKIWEKFSFRRDNVLAWFEAVPPLNTSIDSTHHTILLDVLCRQLN
jgi:hypothetical protein